MTNGHTLGANEVGTKPASATAADTPPGRAAHLPNDVQAIAQRLLQDKDSRQPSGCAHLHAGEVVPRRPTRRRVLLIVGVSPPQGVVHLH